jgi:hypothetical protein
MLHFRCANVQKYHVQKSSAPPSRSLLSSDIYSKKWPSKKAEFHSSSAKPFYLNPFKFTTGRSLLLKETQFNRQDEKQRDYAQNRSEKIKFNFTKMLSLLAALCGAGAAAYLFSSQVLAESQDPSLVNVSVLNKYIENQPVDEKELNLWYDLLLPGF